MELNALLVQFIIFISFSKMLAFGFIDQDERKCAYSRVDRMLKIRCFDMRLTEVPQYLKSSVEVLDLSYNRLKKLTKNSFQKYKSVKYLMLYDNMIQKVEPGTFQDLTDLQEIDLSNNGLLTIPMDILQLPSLRNLYVDSNDLVYLESDLETLSKPIRAPLEYLNVADCGLKNIPDLGVLPKLWHINISSNPLNELSINRFANLCQLKSIDLMRTTIGDCLCQQINSHLRYLGVKTKFVPVCIETLPVEVCPLPFNHTVDSPTFQSCKTTITYAEVRSRWLIAGICCACLLVVVFCIWCCIHKRRKSRKKKRNPPLPPLRKSCVISPKNALNNEKQYKSKIDDGDDDSDQDFKRDHDNNHKNFHNNDALIRCDTA